MAIAGATLLFGCGGTAEHDAQISKADGASGPQQHPTLLAEFQAR